jgi:hypothetical protein
MLFLSIILLFVFITLLIYYIFLLQQRYQYFSRRNISTPRFLFFFGHIKTLWNAASYHRQLESWTKQYGKIYGIYEGALPIFVVSDPDFVQEVFVKQANVFHARKSSIIDDISCNVFTASGAKWRRQRHVINPTFTAAKLKSMSPLINGCVNDLMEKLPDHVEKNDEFNIYLYYKRMTLDVICKYSLVSLVFSFSNQMRIIHVFVQVVVHLELIPMCKIIQKISISKKWKSSSLTVFLINTSYFDLLNLSLRLVISSLDSLLSTVIFELLLILEFYHWSHQQCN